MIKNIYLTFDYELFLGAKSGTIHNCMISPTNMLIEQFDKYNMKATFFVDILFYIKLLRENEETAKEAKLIKEQLKTLVRKGHRIELHLHPHWEDAVYLNGNWVFPSYKHYRLDSLPENRILKYFIDGVNELNNIAREVNADYQVSAFRAGGLCIQPFDKLISSFRAVGVFIDSSVAPGLKVNSNNHSFSFLAITNNDFYKFSTDVCVKDDKGEFTELPLTIIDKTVIDKIFDKVHNTFYYSIYGDGIGMGSKSNKNKSDSFYSRLTKKYTQHLTMDSTSLFSFKRVFKRVENKNIVMMCHPKFLSRDETPKIIKYLGSVRAHFKAIDISDRL